MRNLTKYESGFLAGLATALLASGVTFLLASAIRRRQFAATTGTPISIDAAPPSRVDLDAQPAPEANASESPRLESEAVTDVMIPSQRW
ncbi:MAG: hypothetical protein KIT84_06645 [Labilithrix sp.]|nr:hypothetical protein [Labilithrix sp.]MCW5810671.1 hypothetical protein [Labilithrix sp.]